MMRIEKSSGNVFADIGIADPEAHELKAQLVMRIAKIIEKNEFTQLSAAKVMGISQPDVSKMLNGNFQAFSVERLFRFLTLFGQDVEIAIKKKKSKSAPSQGRVVVTAA